MIERAYNKFQVSKMFGGYQVVIRTETINELLSAMEEMKPLEQELEKLVPHRTEEVKSTLTAQCTVHACSMKEAVSKKTGKPYFYHREGERMCFGKGWAE